MGSALSGISLRGIGLSGIGLSGIGLSGIGLSGIGLSGIGLIGIGLSAALRSACGLARAAGKGALVVRGGAAMPCAAIARRWRAARPTAGEVLAA